MIKKLRMVFLSMLISFMLIFISNKVNANNTYLENSMEQLEITRFSRDSLYPGGQKVETNFWILGKLDEGRKYRIVIENYGNLESRTVQLTYPDYTAITEEGYKQWHSGNVKYINLEKSDEDSNTYYYDFTATDFDNNITSEIKSYYLRINFKNDSGKDGLYKLYFYGEKIKEPDKVTGLEVESKTESSIKLKWMEDAEATEYEVYQYNTAKEIWENIGTTYGTSYEIKNLKEGDTYKFKVRACKTITSGKKYYGAYSEELQASTNVITPNEVIDLRSELQTTSSIELKWSEDLEATIYEVYMFNNSNEKWENVGSTSETYYTINGLKEGTTYKFKVRACKILNKEKYYGAYSSELQVATKVSDVSDSNDEIIVKVTYSETSVTRENIKVTIEADRELQEVVGWTLSDDGMTLTKTFTENGSEVITIYDLAGNSASVNVNVSNIDRKNPEATVSYNETEKTNKDVLVTIKVNEPIQEVEGWTLSDDGMTLTKTFTENGSEVITIYDLAGNSASVNVKVENIDKGNIDRENIDESPLVLEINYNTTSNRSVVVTITANKKIKDIDGWILSNDEKSLSKEYTENKIEEITIYDYYENSANVIINVSNINNKEDLYNDILPSAGENNMNVILIAICILLLYSIVLYKKMKLK